jgi:hypothetical protein
MITIKADGTSYEIKTSYTDWTVGEYLNAIQVMQKPFIDRLSHYSNIPINVLNSWQIESVAQIADNLAHIENEPILKALAKPYEGVYIGNDTWSKLEQSKQLMKGSNLLTALPSIIKIYTDIDIEPMPLLDGYSIAMHYMNSFSYFFDRFKELNEHEHDEIEELAGVETLTVFGHFPSVVKIGRERGMTNSEVLALSAEEVYMEMLLDFRQRKFQKKYQDLSEKLAPKNS